MIKYLNINQAIMEHLTSVNIITGQSLYFTNKIIAKIKSIEKEKVFVIQSIESVKNYKKSILIIKYPENNCNTQSQKELINQILNTDNQVFIFTNSPFIINTSAVITQEQKDDCFCNKIEFKPIIKVYYLPDNKTATKKGEFIIDRLGKNKGRYGYYGKKASLIASKLIANGLNIKEQKNVSTVNNNQIPFLVICEGQNSNADSHIYNIIFEQYKAHPVMFVSSRGSSQAAVSFELLRQMLNSIDADLKVCMLRDRDHEFPSEVDIIKYKKNYQGRKVLNRRAIECYLYNSETANLLLNKIGLEITTKQKLKMDRLQEQIQKEVEAQELGHSYKSRLKELFYAIINPYLVKYNMEGLKPKDDLVFEIARIIDNKTEIYNELSNSIFE